MERRVVTVKKYRRMLTVFLNNKLVGRLEKSAARDLTFTYDATWLNMPGARPVSLSLPLPLASQSIFEGMQFTKRQLM